MTLRTDIISKTIGQILVAAAIIAYWAPVVDYVGHKVQDYLPVMEASAHSPKNTTIAYEVINPPVSASAID